MVNKCCIPGCNSDYDSSVAKEGLTRCFTFPKDENAQEIWLSKIPQQLIDASRGTFEIAVADDISNYFENLNRGGLTYRSNFLISVYQAAYHLLHVLQKAGKCLFQNVSQLFD